MELHGALLLLIVLAAGSVARADVAWRRVEPAPAVAPIGLCEQALAAETDLDPATAAEAVQRWRELEGRLQAEGLTSLPRQEAAQRLLTFVHDRALFGRYRPDASRLSGTLRHGDYNCLSATLLYVALAERIELSVEGAVWPAHVACQVAGESGLIDIEPTCREWFSAPDAAARETLRRDALAALGLPFDRAEPRRLDRRQLLALAYFNFGTERLTTDSAGAIAALERARALDPSSPAIRANLLAALNNQAVVLQRQGSANAARELLHRCQQIAPQDPLTAENLARLAP